MGKPRFVMISLVLMTLGAVAWSQEASPGAPADAALARLMEGNRRYTRHKAKHPDESLSRRKDLEGTQHPFAVILGSADSRVPPELLFDQGLGDLFVIRVAGNIVDDAILGSIEYAVEHLGAKLILVLGHEKCGAVTAAIEGGAAAGHLADWSRRFGWRWPQPPTCRGTRFTIASSRTHAASPSRFASPNRC